MLNAINLLQLLKLNGKSGNRPPNTARYLVPFGTCDFIKLHAQNAYKKEEREKTTTLIILNEINVIWMRERDTHTHTYMCNIFCYRFGWPQNLVMRKKSFVILSNRACVFVCMHGMDLRFSNNMVWCLSFNHVINGIGTVIIA